MDAEAVNAQIKQMVAFIKQEAEEKALELSTRANEERAIERARLLQEAKVRIAAEFEQKERQVEVTKRIAQSTAVAQSRLQVLEARDGEVDKLVESARGKLRDLAAAQGAECE